MSKLDKNPRAFPFMGIESTEENGIYVQRGEIERDDDTKFVPHEGMSLRDYFATKVKDDFDVLHISVQEKIVGEKCPSFITEPSGIKEIHKDIASIEYVMWLAKGRAKWRFMQADTMLEERVLMDVYSR